MLQRGARVEKEDRSVLVYGRLETGAREGLGRCREVITQGLSCHHERRYHLCPGGVEGSTPWYRGRMEGRWIGSGDLPPEKVLKPTKQDSKIDLWTRWIEGTIRNEVLTMHHHQAVYSQVAEIVNTREPKLPDSLFFDYLRGTYATSQAAAIRRQAEQNSRVLSLGRLLSEIKAEPERLTRQRFVGAWPPEDQRRGHETFSGYFAGDVGDNLDPEIVGHDIARLKMEAKKVVDHVDKYVAHADESPRAELATFEDLNAVIAMIGDLFKKYALLLTGSSYAMLAPVPQHNWEAIFELPWLVTEK